MAKLPRLVGDRRFERPLMSDEVMDPTWVPLFKGRPLTPAERASFRQLLIDRGDVRGEVLSLAEELMADVPPDDADAKRARLTELLAQIDPLWWRQASELPYLLNCGQARQYPAAVHFAFACPRSWEEMLPTGMSGVRHCESCNEDVHHAETVVAAEALARRGKCIAVPADIADAGGYPQGRGMIAGRPQHPVQKWSDRIFGGLPDD